jgi:ERCC4-type nuclease
LSYLIKIDNRETAFAEFMTKDGYAFDLEPLDVGDIQFVHRASKIPFIIIERKTYPDLEASIKDGRYKEQKERMLKAYPYKVRKILLLEGNPAKFHMGEKTLRSVIINSMIRDHISVYCCRDFAEICILLETIILNLPKYVYELIQSTCVISGDNTIPTFENSLEAYTHSVKTGKKENLTPSICFRNMLCQINGISNNVADMLVEKYDHMYGFIHTMKTKYADDYMGMSREVGELKYGKGNGRKVGVIGRNIISQLFNVNLPEEEKSGSGKKSKTKSKVIDISNVFSDD